MARFCSHYLPSLAPLPLSKSILPSLFTFDLVASPPPPTTPPVPLACSSSPPSPTPSKPFRYLSSRAVPRRSSLDGSAVSMLAGSRNPTVTCRAAISGAGAACNDNSNREVLVQHILVKEDQLQLLLDLQRKVTQEGVDLGDLASEYSICSSKNEGGMLGWIQKGQTVDEFEEAAFSAPLNKLIRVRTKYGWHLLQVLSQRDASFLKEIQPEELHTLIQDNTFLDEAQLIDVREADEISTAAVKGFKPYPLSQFGVWAPTIIEDLDPSKDIYVMCHHGVRSLQAAQWLQTQGFRRVYNVAGGIHAYSSRADKSIPVY